MQKKLAIKDIAKELNISKTSISFVLNGKARERGISIALEQRILKYIKEVGYKPNRMARGLRTGKSNIIGMMIEDISDPFFSSIARLVEEYADKKGYRIIYGSTENNSDKTIDLIEIFRNHQVDAYIIAPPPGIERYIQELLNDGLPVVIFDRSLPGIKTDTVMVDNYNGTYDAIKHLIQNGYKNIAMVTLASEQDQMLFRLDAYHQVTNDYKLPGLVTKIIYHEDKQESIQHIQDFIKDHKEIDALFFATNYIAINGLEALKKLELKISVDIGVAVFDDYNSFTLFTPTITAVSQPVAEISKSLIDNIMDRFKNKTSDLRNVILKTSLEIRESSSRL